MEPEPEFAHEQSPQRVARQLSADHILELETEAAAAATQRVGSVPTAPGCSSGSAVAVAKQGDSAARLSADAKGPLQTLVDPQPDPSHPFRSCLDREYVQKEIRWAWKYKKKIIVLFEKDQRRAGFFDHGEAWGKYRGTEWEAILNIDAEPYQRDEIYAQGMVQKILQKAQGVPGAAVAVPALNAPGSWDLFLSHAQAAGGDQVQTTSLRMEKAGKTVWYDNAMDDRSTAAMEEGVKHSRCFMLFLTGAPPPHRPTAPPATNTLRMLVAQLVVIVAVLGLGALLYNVKQQQLHNWDQLRAGYRTAVCDVSIGVCTCGPCCPGSGAGNSTACNRCVMANCSPQALADLELMMMLLVLASILLRFNDFLCVLHRCCACMWTGYGRCRHRNRAAPFDNVDSDDDLGRSESAKMRAQTLSEYLVSTFAFGVAVAEAYVQELAKQHIDTPAVFDTLSVAELKRDFGFQRGDFIKMQLARQPPDTTADDTALGLARRVRGGDIHSVLLHNPAQSGGPDSDDIELMVTMEGELVTLKAKHTDTIASIRKKAQRAAQNKLVSGSNAPLATKGGYTARALYWYGSSWAKAMEANGQSPAGATLTAAGRLLFWHWLQPVVYWGVFAYYYDQVDGWQKCFGWAVAVREAEYVIATLVALCANPAFLLVDVGASVRDTGGTMLYHGRMFEVSGYLFLTMYVLMPQQFVTLAHALGGGFDWIARWPGLWSVGVYQGILLDLCGVGGLIAGLTAGSLPVALAVGYGITAFVGLGIIVFFTVYELLHPRLRARVWADGKSQAAYTLDD
jgi:hypothetical protein